MMSHSNNGFLCYFVFLLSLVATVSSFFIVQGGNSYRHFHGNEDFWKGSSALSMSKVDVQHLTHIDRVLVISDLHTDHVDNMRWVANRMNSSNTDLKESDLIVVAGDISHELHTLERSFNHLLEQGSSVIFVPGNHEAWLKASELDDGSSLEKLERIYRSCEKLGVLTGCIKVGGTPERPHCLWVAPLESWYDGTLAIDGCEDLCDDFGGWPWVDFIRCRWPGFPSKDGERFPSGLTEHFYNKNLALLESLQESVAAQPSYSSNEASRAVMFMSHFLPNKQCLPDWKDVDSPTFQRDTWLDHGGGGVSAKFALVAGTQQLEDQVRSFGQSLPTDIRQIHLFGHSHRPKDFEMDSIRCEYSTVLVFVGNTRNVSKLTHPSSLSYL